MARLPIRAAHDVVLRIWVRSIVDPFLPLSGGVGGDGDRLMGVRRRDLDVVGVSGVFEELGVFFKYPMTRDAYAYTENALHKQEDVLLSWLKS